MLLLTFFVIQFFEKQWLGPTRGVKGRFSTVYTPGHKITFSKTLVLIYLALKYTMICVPLNVIVIWLTV